MTPEKGNWFVSFKMNNIICQLAINFNGIAVVGEAPGEEETKHGLPFVGRAGKLLNRALIKTGINRNDCHVTNVFWYRPPDNDVGYFFVNRLRAKKDNIEFCDDIPISKSGYLKKIWREEFDRLDKELFNLNPKIVIALGSTALWRLTGKTMISEERGKLQKAILLKTAPDLNVLPTFHPSAALRNPDWYSAIVDDLRAITKLTF